MFSAEYEQNLRRLRFPEVIESAFQRDYYGRHRTMARITLWFLAIVTTILSAVSLYFNFYSLAFVLMVALLADGLLLWHLQHQSYLRSWQPLGLGAIFLTLSAGLYFLFFLSTTRSSVDLTSGLGVFFALLALSSRRYLRLQRRWLLPLYLAALVIISSWNYITNVKQSEFSLQSTTSNSDAGSAGNFPQEPDTLRENLEIGVILLRFLLSSGF